MLRLMAKIYKDEGGATSIEYALIAALIAIAAILAMTTIGANLANTFNDLADELSS